MLELPVDDPTNPLRLADWLELYAMFSPDYNSSLGDLESALRVAAFVELDDSEAIEVQTLEVFDELEERVKTIREAYPFNLDDRGVLQLKSSWEDFPAYVFCLLLSYYPLSETRVAPKLFEQISCLAASGYLQGEAIGFGAPRTELPSSFAAAVTEMCTCIGEGRGYREQSSHRRQDDTVDLVARKDFTDKRPSKILMFGQCGCGQHWTNKLGELQPKVFCDQWMQVNPIHPPARSFFTPHRVERGNWEFYSRKAGILFDRCRVAFWAHHRGADYGPYVVWIKDLLSQVAL